MNKLCECGCGKEVKINRDTKKANRFLLGHDIKNIDIQRQMKETCKKNYGVEHPLQSKEIQEKIKQTNLQKIGFDNPFKNPEIKEKIRLKNQQMLNVDYPMQSKKIKEKQKQTCLKKYGVEYVFQSKIAKEKGKKTCISHYGVEYAGQSKEIQNKIAITSKNKYNGIGFSSPILAQKTNSSIQKKYGVDNYSKTSEFKQLARQSMKNSIMKNYPNSSQWCPRKGNFEKEVFDEIQKHCQYQLMEDQSFIGLSPDRYIKELNLIVELYEPWHKRNYWIKHDLIRQHELEDHLYCKFFIIWLKDWKENKDQVIFEFKNLILSLSEQK